MGRRGKARVRLAENYKASTTTLLENRENEKPVGEILVVPYALISLRVSK